jgi:hypothetical protein
VVEQTNGLHLQVDYGHDETALVHEKQVEVPFAETTDQPKWSTEGTKLILNLAASKQGKWVSMTLDTSQLSPFAQDYNLMIIVRVLDNHIDALTDTGIAKSSLFTITEEVGSRAAGEVMDEAILNIGQYFSMPSPGPVPTVDPADLRSVWELMQKAEGLVQKAGASLPKREVEDSAQSGIGTSYDFPSLGLPIPTNAGCSPGADVGAVWYRVEMMEWLEGLRRTSHITKVGSLLSEIANLPDFDYSKPSDAVFKALAVVPMTGIAPSGFPLQGFPLDISEFAKLVSRCDSPDPH